MNQPLIPYGLLNGSLVHVDTVANGLACGCTCPQCGSALNARNRATRVRTHFAHAAEANCEGAYETIIHLLAKHFIAQHKCIGLPRFSRTISSKDLEVQPFYTHYVEDEDIAIFDHVEIETAVNGYIPDAIGWKENGERILVEFFVTHRVDKEKLERMNHPAASHGVSG